MLLFGQTYDKGIINLKKSIVYISTKNQSPYKDGFRCNQEDA